MQHTEQITLNIVPGQFHCTKVVSSDGTLSLRVKYCWLHAESLAGFLPPQGASIAPGQGSAETFLAGVLGSGQGNFDGKFEALDLAELTKKQPWWRKLFGQESGPSAEKYSVATQLVIGGVTGWCTGFVFQKVGKLAATAVGGGFFLLQLANHTGYIKVDWQRVEKDMKKAKEQLKIRKNKQIPTEVKSKAEEVVSFVKKNVLVTGGFFGGFLLGMAS